MARHREPLGSGFAISSALPLALERTGATVSGSLRLGLSGLPRSRYRGPSTWSRRQAWHLRPRTRDDLRSDCRLTVSADFGIFVVSLVAGLIGALAGVGGGILVVPALTSLFGVDIRLAVGASIVSVIATSSGAAAAYVRDRMTDMRVGMFLELATTTGAVCGALLAAVVAPSLLYVLLGLVLLGLGGPAGAAPRRGAPAGSTVASRARRRLRLESARTRTDGSGARSRTSRQRGPARLRADVGRGPRVGPARDRLGRPQGPGDGRRDAPADEGQLGHEQLHDRRHRGRVGRHLPGPRRRGPHDRGAGRARRPRRRADRRPPSPPLRTGTVRLVFLPVLVAVGLETLARGLGFGL